VRYHYPVTLLAQDVRNAQEKPTEHELNHNTRKKKYGHLSSEAQFLSYALLQIRVNVQKMHLEPEPRNLPDLLGN
jgi:hypothetical protein